MVYNLRVKPGAEEDIDAAYNWYEDQKEGLGEEFLAELVEFYKKLKSHPKSFHKVKRNYRQIALKRFPYMIVFEVLETDVIIYAVFHTSRHPKNKFRKR